MFSERSGFNPTCNIKKEKSRLWRVLLWRERNYNLLGLTLLGILSSLLLGLDRQVFCISKGDAPHDDCTCITHIGFGVEIITREEAIRRIDDWVDTFWVEDPMDRSRINVKVATRGSIRYLRTKDDDTDRDNLLKLREC